MGLCAIASSLNAHLARIDKSEARESFIDTSAEALSFNQSVTVNGKRIDADEIIEESPADAFHAVLWELFTGKPETARFMLRQAVYKQAFKKIEELL